MAARVLVPLAVPRYPLPTMRNWTNLDAFGVSRFLYFYRLVGVAAFELSQIRALLLVFPNTFEYFFDFYEAVRAR